MLFAICMGTSRFLYGLYGDKLSLPKAMSGSAVLCIVSYLIISLSPVPALSLVGCGICGFSVGIMWPGTFSLALRKGGSPLAHRLLACSGGPSFVGLISDSAGRGLHFGILCAIVFPAVLLLGVLLSGVRKKDLPENAENPA